MKSRAAAKSYLTLIPGKDRVQETTGEDNFKGGEKKQEEKKKIQDMQIRFSPT